MLPFSGGLTFALLSGIEIPFLPALVGIGIAVLPGVLPRKRKHSPNNNSWLVGGFLFIALFLSGWVWMQIGDTNSNPAHFAKLYESEGVVVGRLAMPPEVKAKSVKAQIDVEAINGKAGWLSVSGNALVYLPKDSFALLLQQDDRILFRPDFQSISQPGNPEQFDYRRYLSFHLIYHQAFLKAGQWVKLEPENEGFTLPGSAGLRNHLLALIAEHIKDDDASAIASALVLGYRDRLDAEVKKSYAAAGAMHVLAVSGLHVGIIYMVFLWLTGFLRPMKGGKLMQAGILLVVLWAYATLTGLSPSVMRAATMFSFIVIGGALRRPVNIWNSIAVSAFVLLLYNPYLIADVGFQLSYAAVMGIVYFYPKLHRRWSPNNWLVRQIWSLTVVSIAAQLATFPLSLFYFHQFPNYFLLSNLVVIPAATIILYLGLVLFIVSPAAALAEAVGWLLDQVITALNSAVQWIENLPGSISDGIFISWWECGILYLMLILFARYFHIKKPRVLQAGIACAVVLALFQLKLQYSHEIQRKLIVYDIRKTTALNLIDGKENILFSNLEEVNTNSLEFAVRNHWMKMGIEAEKHQPISKMNNRFLLSNLYRINNPNVFQKQHFIGFYNQRILLLNDDFHFPEGKQLGAGRIKVDVVILSENANISYQQLFDHIQCTYLIIDSSNHKGTINKWKQSELPWGTSMHIIEEQGAFILDL